MNNEVKQTSIIWKSRISDFFHSVFSASFFEPRLGSRENEKIHHPFMVILNKEIPDQVAQFLGKGLTEIKSET